MPDITMCKNNDCSKKDSCYRFKTIPDEYQSYFVDKMDWPCEYYCKTNEK